MQCAQCQVLVGQHCVTVCGLKGLPPLPDPFPGRGNYGMPTGASVSPPAKYWANT